MGMTRISALIGLVMVVSACGGGGALPGTPSPSNGIAGTWRGTITFTKPVLQTVATTWTFTPLAQTSGMGYEVQASWPGVTTRAMTAAVLGSQFSTGGVYPSALGCDGTVGGDGTADSRVIDATFSAISTCDPMLIGHMTLTR
jgi:hypothetical protein